MDYKPTYKDLFSAQCVGWSFKFFSQVLTVLTYISILGLDRWLSWEDNIALSRFGLFAMIGDGSKLYYWDSDCSSLLLSACRDLEVAGKTIFSLLFVTLIFSLVHLGILATFKLGNAPWYKRWMLILSEFWQGILLTAVAIWWTAGLKPKLESVSSWGYFDLDRSLLYSWVYPFFTYFVYLPTSFKLSFVVEAAPGEEGVSLVDAVDSAASAKPIPAAAAAGGRGGSGRTPAPPAFSPSASSPVAAPHAPFAGLTTSSDGDEKSPIDSPSPAPEAAPEAAPRRPPPPKSKPNVKKWRKEYDDNYKEYYYVNIKTNESQWEKPDDFQE